VSFSRERASEIHAQIAALPAEQRSGALDRLCAGDAHLREAVEALLIADQPTIASAPDGPTVADAPTMASFDHASAPEPLGERPGSVIGPYTLREVIGEGGFGTVFLAEQAKPVARQVALKIIKLGMDTRQVVARFEQERQALAILDHPSIAKVFDAGATETGRPYFVMEYCTGERIDAYCDRHRLGIRERMDLFAQVCAAVQHAHTKGLIHRDLKPSNVLVSTQDGKPLAKVIDFGIAKATASKLTERTLFTEQRQIVGTLEYMSPEQAEGNPDIDTRTDVYSLGVMLYELLAGSPPFTSRELRSAAFAELQRIIREVDPPRPSTRLTRSAETISTVATQRRTDPQRLRSALKGELDWIVMKSLEKDRARRYPSPSALAEDIRRYLAGEAVTAAPPSRVYRARKFVSRHRAAVTAAALIAVALLLGIVGTSVGLVRANEQRRLAESARLGEAEQRTLAEARLAQSEATVKFLDDMLAAADPIAQGKDVTVRAVLDNAAGTMAPKFESQPLVAARLHGTIGRTYIGLGEYAPAEEHLRAQLDIYRNELGPESRDACRAVNELGVLLIKNGRHDEAEALLKRAVADHERLFGRADPITAQSVDVLAQLYGLQMRTADSVALAREVLDRRRGSLGDEHPDTVSAMNSLAMILADAEQSEEAKSLFEEALAIQERLAGPDHPLTLQISANLAWMYYWSADSLKHSDPAEFQRRLDRSREIGERTLEARRRVLGEEHHDTLTSMNNLAAVYRSLGLNDLADELTLKDIEVSVRTLGEEHPDTITSIANMGNSLRRRERYEEANAYFERALKNARKSMPPDAPGTAFILGWYGSSLRDLGRFAEGEPMLLEARGIIGRTLGDDHPIAGHMAKDLAALYEAWDKAEPGAGHGAKAAEWKTKADAPD